MTRKASLVIVLVEDRLQQRFVRSILTKLGYPLGVIRFQPLPGGGSGEQWVRKNYATQIQELRSRVEGRRASTALVVAIDADLLTLDDRLRQLDQVLRESAVPIRSSAEPVTILVPRRNMETWILCLNGQQVDEQQDYKQRMPADASVLEAARSFVDWSSRPRGQVPGNCIPSIFGGFGELSRIPRL